MFTDEPHLGYNYVQAGQENSFTWEAMEKGFVYQTARLADLRKKGKVRIQTLAETGRWFRERYPVTPPTSVITTEDYQGNGRKTFWFNSRYYRANLLWEGSALKIRDLHVFNENLRSEYLDRPDTLPVFHYETLPLVDGCLWSTKDKMAGLYLIAPDFEGGEPVFASKADESGQEITWPSAVGKGRFTLSFTEEGFEMAADAEAGSWCLELSASPGAALPFTTLTEKAVLARHQGMEYGMELEKGYVEDLRIQGAQTLFRLVPEEGRIAVKF